MTWEPQHLGQLETAIHNLDRLTVDSLCGRLIVHVDELEHPFPLPEAKRILSLLRRKRFFSQLCAVADAFLRSELTAGIIRRLYAQGLIEEGELTAAIGVLEKLINDCPNEPSELAEARGLIGRALKQQYVEGKQRPTPARARLINRAIASYHDVYSTDRGSFLWHGINAVACAMRAERDGVTLERTIDSSGIASEILATIARRPEDSIPYWDLACAAEASLALGRTADALDWLARYVAKPVSETDAFEVASTLRQIEQVWQLREDGGAPGKLVSVLKAALLQREGGGVALSVEAQSATQESVTAKLAAFEKVFGDAGPRTYEWYMAGAARARAVARVEDRFGRGVGTGFLVRARDFVADAPDGAVLLLTNAHVLGLTESGALRPDDARVRFEAVDGTTVFAVERLVWESSASHLDATLVQLRDLTAQVAPLIPAPSEPPEFTEGEPRRFYVIGHPLGGQLSISIDDNRQVGWRRPLLHYRTPTHPGNSGSPVLDEQWRLVALHHAGSKQMQRLDEHPGFYEANEGIWIHDIMIAARGGGAPPASSQRAVEAVAIAATLGAGTPSPPRKRLFVSYSHADRKFLGELQKVLRPLTRDGDLVLWSDTDITVGAAWRAEIEDALHSARVAVLLVSSDFLASDFIATHEFPQLLERAKSEGLKIVWVPVGPSLYEKTPLVNLQAASNPQLPLNSFGRAERQGFWVKIAQQIAELLD